MDAETGEVTQRFAASDLPDLTRLIQALAFAISTERDIDAELRDDLSWLAACLDDGSFKADAPASPPVPQEGVYQALRDILDYLLEDEQRHFRDHSSERHIYHSLLLVESWLARCSQKVNKEAR